MAQQELNTTEDEALDHDSLEDIDWTEWQETVFTQKGVNMLCIHKTL